MTETELRGVLELMILVLERTRTQIKNGDMPNMIQQIDMEYAEARGRRALRLLSVSDSSRSLSISPVA